MTRLISFCGKYHTMNSFRFGSGLPKLATNAQGHVSASFDILFDIVILAIVIVLTLEEYTSVLQLSSLPLPLPFPLGNRYMDPLHCLP